MEKNNYPWTGCGTDKEITGCRFSLSVMSNDFISKILTAIQDVSAETIWASTDAISTTYRGKREHVMQAVRDVFVRVNDGRTHVTMEATFSKGCPGDVDEDSILSDRASFGVYVKNFDVLCKIAFYPLGVASYMEHIAHVVNLAIERRIYHQSSHYATEIKGDVYEIFAFFDEIMKYGEAHLDHFVLQTTLSINSPTKQ